MGEDTQAGIKIGVREVHRLLARLGDANRSNAGVGAPALDRIELFGDRIDNFELILQACGPRQFLPQVDTESAQFVAHEDEGLDILGHDAQRSPVAVRAAGARLGMDIGTACQERKYNRRDQEAAQTP